MEGCLSDGELQARIRGKTKTKGRGKNETKVENETKRGGMHVLWRRRICRFVLVWEDSGHYGISINVRL